MSTLLISRGQEGPNFSYIAEVVEIGDHCFDALIKREGRINPNT